MNIFSSERFEKCSAFAKAHKITSAMIVVAVLGAGYYGYGALTSTTGETRYVLATASKGTVIAAITGSGQVSALNLLDLKPKASGDVVRVGVVNGQEVSQGALVIQLDATSAQKAVRDAEVNLASTKLSLEKVRQAADTLSVIQAENALAQSSASLEKSYDDGFNSVSNAFLDLPGIMTGMQDVLYGTTVNRSQDNLSAYADMVKEYNESVLLFKSDAAAKYQKARESYDKSFVSYRVATRSSSREEIEKLGTETYATTRDVAEAVKSMNDLLGFVKERLAERNRSAPSTLTTHQTLLGTYISKTNAALIDLLAVQTSMTTAKYTLAEKTESLKKLKAGADPLDIQTTELSLTQRENALLDARENLANYFVYTPFAGAIAKLNIKKGDAVSASTVLATLITRQKIAEISLNEVDAAKVSVGQKVTLTFDAVEGLTIAGEVVEVDTVGVVSQGVVTYVVKIGFKTQDDRVKSGMSVSASIITNMKQDVLTVPNSAVKTQGGASYVEVLEAVPATLGTKEVSNTTATPGTLGVLSPVPPRRQQVEVGLSNDTTTEIVTGLSEGDQVVVRTIPAATTATQAPSIFNAAGIRTPGAAGQRNVGR